MLGKLYYVGLGVKKRLHKSGTLVRTRGMQGNSIAQHNMTLNPIIRAWNRKNVVAAAAWFLLAESGSNPTSETYLRRLPPDY